MCGIVGLHLTDPTLHPRLGELLAPMLDCMSSRGPDSAGLALYGDHETAAAGALRFSLRADEPLDWTGLARTLGARLEAPVAVSTRPGGAVLTTAADEADVLVRLRADAPGAVLVGHGRAMEVFKDTGAPREICERYGIAALGGYQGIGHTRMATESAVTTDHSHPFAPAADMALVHNGSFSNHATVSRRLERDGIHCVTDNDSEVAARFVAQQVAQGAGLGDALHLVQKEFDGFFTLLVTTATEFAVLRDSFACKPAVIAETDAYVAVSSEYHALAGLPGIGEARVFEPDPEEVYAWRR
jgi:glutamate synthase domain-containing protein 1